MGLDHSLEVKINHNIGVCDNHIFFFLIPQKVQKACEGSHTADIRLCAGLLCKGRENMQTAVLTHQIPLTAGIQVIHQGMVIVVHHYRNIVNAAVSHAG